MKQSFLFSFLPLQNNFIPHKSSTCMSLSRNRGIQAARMFIDGEIDIQMLLILPNSREISFKHLPEGGLLCSRMSPNNVSFFLVSKMA